MKKRTLLLKLALLIALTLSLGGPAFLSIDPWDPFPDPGDSLLVVVSALVLCVCAVLIHTLRVVCSFIERTLDGGPVLTRPASNLSLVSTTAGLPPLTVCALRI